MANVGCRSAPSQSSSKPTLSSSPTDRPLARYSSRTPGGERRARRDVARRLSARKSRPGLVDEVAHVARRQGRATWCRRRRAASSTRRAPSRASTRLTVSSIMLS